MNHVMQPVHPHQHRVWWVPDTPLGQWAAILFTGAALTVILAPLIGAGVGMVTSGSTAPWFFALWGAMLVALALAAIAGAVALVALIRDHALLLVVPVMLGIIGTGVLALTSDWPI